MIDTEDKAWEYRGRLEKYIAAMEHEADRAELHAATVEVYAENLLPPDADQVMRREWRRIRDDAALDCLRHAVMARRFSESMQKHVDLINGYADGDPSPTMAHCREQSTCALARSGETLKRAKAAFAAIENEIGPTAA